MCAQCAGQERAAASHRPTARELHRVSADGTLLQVVTKFAGMYVALQVQPLGGSISFRVGLLLSPASREPLSSSSASWPT